MDAQSTHISAVKLNAQEKGSTRYLCPACNKYQVLNSLWMAHSTRVGYEMYSRYEVKSLKSTGI